MAETYGSTPGKFMSKVATKAADKKSDRKPGRRRATRYREAFAGAARRNSGGGSIEWVN